MKEIWVLGSKHSKAHRSLGWLSSFPNFSNTDILIVNLESLGTMQFQKRQNQLYNEARRYIFDMLMAGEKQVIIVMSPRQDVLTWLPFVPILEDIAPARLAEFEGNSMLGEYLKMVEECSYYIHSFDGSYFKIKTNPKSSEHENYFFTDDAMRGYGYEMVVDYHVKNRANQPVGGSLRSKIHYGSVSMGAGTTYFEGSFVSGPIVFLPPPTKGTAEEGIDAILNVLLGGKAIETPPRWDSKIDLPGLHNLETQFAQKEKEKSRLIIEIEELNLKKDDIIKLRRLLWVNGESLENTVRDAFVVLGFPEIRKIRPPNLEDWIIDFKHVDKFRHGVFEVKGAEKRTSLADLTQCNKWVEDYLLDNVNVKGIFVSNQYRRMDIRKSLDKREEFAPNELTYAQERKICMLPTHEIFKALIEKMKGNKEITRKSIEQKIVSADGLCKLI